MRYALIAALCLFAAPATAGSLECMAIESYAKSQERQLHEALDARDQGGKELSVALTNLIEKSGLNREEELPAFNSAIEKLIDGQPFIDILFVDDPLFKALKRDLCP